MTRQNNNHIFQRFGDLDLPIEGSDVTSGRLFSAFDPGRDAMLALFKAAICQELGHHPTTAASTSAWYTARTGTALATAEPIETTLTEAPRRSLFRGARYDFPLLCLYRVSTVHSELTLGHDQQVTTWGLDYVLGPLVSSDYERLGGAMNAVRKIVSLVIRRGHHPAYESDAIQFGDDHGRFTSIRILNDQEGPATMGLEGPSARGMPPEELELYTLHMNLETTEIEDALDPIAEATPYDGSDINLGVGGMWGIIPDLIQADTGPVQQPPYGDPEG